MPTPPSKPVITTVDEAEAAFKQFQDALAREAVQNGHPREFGVLIDRAIAQVPGLRAVGSGDSPPVPAGTMNLAVRFKALPGTTHEDFRTLSQGRILRKSHEFMKDWAQNNGYPLNALRGDGGYTSEQQILAYVLHHPDEVDFHGRDNNAYINEYTVTNHGNQPTEGATQRRVEFVRSA